MSIDPYRSSGLDEDEKVFARELSSMARAIPQPGDSEGWKQYEGRVFRDRVKELLRAVTRDEEKRKYENAASAAQQAFYVAQRELGYTEKLTIKSLEVFVDCHDRLGRFAESEGILREAVSVLKGEGNNGCPGGIARLLIRLAHVHYKQERFDEALSCLDEAGGKCGKDVASQMAVYLASARCWAEKGESVRAQWAFDEALKVHAKAGDSRLLDRSFVLNTKAFALVLAGDVSGAEHAYREALVLEKEAKCAAEWLVVASSYNGLGIVHHKLGGKAFRLARKYYVEGLEKRIEVLGEDHPDVAQSWHNLAYMCYDWGKEYESCGAEDAAGAMYKDAERMYERAIDIRHRCVGRRHPDLAYSWHHLGHVHLAQGKHKEALNGFEKAIDIQVSVWGRDVLQSGLCVRFAQGIVAEESVRCQLELAGVQ